MDKQLISEFVDCKEVAVVGVSKRKFGGSIYRTLKSRGYRVYPVHPTHSEFDGDKCHRNLAELPESVKAAVIAISPTNAEEMLAETARTPVSRLWFQQGANFDSVAARAEVAGFKVVTGKCILMYAPPVTGIHGFHRWLAKLFGRL